MVAYPNIPTVAESGLPDFEMNSWYGLWGPANLPKEIVSKLAEQVSLALKNKVIKDRMSELEFEPSTINTAQFEKLVRDETIRVGAVAREANISID